MTAKIAEIAKIENQFGGPRLLGFTNESGTVSDDNPFVADAPGNVL